MAITIKTSTAFNKNKAMGTRILPNRKDRKGIARSLIKKNANVMAINGHISGRMIFHHKIVASKINPINIAASAFITNPLSYGNRCLAKIYHILMPITI